MAAKVLFLFLDGVGLGEADPAVNPLAGASMPNLQFLLNGRPLVSSTAPMETDRVTLLALDACLGVEGLPQSATGQATLMTGVNVPAEIGRHYGPKPNVEIARILENGNLFNTLQRRQRKAALLNGYPQQYFDAIEAGRRLYSALPFAVTCAGMRLKTAEDLLAGKALSADFTGQGWRDRLGYTQTPLLSPFEAGVRLAELAHEYDFALFEYWISDYVGHRQDMAAALEALETLDGVVGGLSSTWDVSSGLVLITSDHGNLEDLRTRRHTANPVPLMLVGPVGLRREFVAGLNNLAGVAPAILKTILE